MDIQKQQLIADSILTKLEAIDPFCILAGGAPRDWFFAREATDLDIYLHIPLNQNLRVFQKRLNAIGIRDAVLSDVFNEDSPYKRNPLVRWVLSFVWDGVVVQLIVMTESTFSSVVQYFPLSICKVYWKNGVIRDACDYTQFGVTVAHKAIVKTGDAYSAGGWYIEKIKTKFPDFKYYETMHDFCADKGLLYMGEVPAYLLG